MVGWTLSLRWLPLIDNGKVRLLRPVLFFYSGIGFVAPLGFGKFSIRLPSIRSLRLFRICHDPRSPSQPPPPSQDSSIALIPSAAIWGLDYNGRRQQRSDRQAACRTAALTPREPRARKGKRCMESTFSLTAGTSPSRTLRGISSIAVVSPV